MLDPLRKRQQNLNFLSENLESEDENKTQSFGWKCVKLGTSACCGVIFGFALEKGRVFEPSVIRDQMLFSRFVMLKMLLSAVATSMLGFSVLAMLPFTSRQFARATRTYISGFSNKGVLSSVVGGAVLGMGMSLSRACPGMVFVQVGAFTDGAVFTLLGGLCGVVCYAMVEPAIVRATKPEFPITKHYLHQHLGGPYFTLALPCVAILGMGVFAVELFAPWASEVPTGGEGLLTSFSWPPYLAGIVVGLLQMLVVIFLCDTLGSTGSFCTIVAQPLWKYSSYLSQFRSGLSNWWQVLYVGGAVIGAFLSSSLSGSIGKAAGTSPVAGFAGGALMLFGSRLAAGCTSGHGLSGFGLLSVLSLVTVPAMFAGGIAMAVFMKQF